MQDIQSPVSTADLMREHLQQQFRSGLTVQRYCLEHGVNKSTFYYWKKKMEQQEEQSAAGFIEMHPSRFCQGNTTIYFPNTVSICFDALPPLDYLKKLIC